MSPIHPAINGKLTQIVQTRLSNEDQLHGWIAENETRIGHDLLILGREIATDFRARIEFWGWTKTEIPS